MQISSRQPQTIFNALKSDAPRAQLLAPVAVDITKPHTLEPAFDGAAVVISLVGIMHGSRQLFEEVQWKGTQNVAKAAQRAKAKLIHVSAIGADEGSKIDYARTKALGEAAVWDAAPDSTIIRPSLIFGPGDDFFAVCRAQLLK